MKLFLPGKNSKIRNKQIILKLRKPGSEKKKKKKSPNKNQSFFLYPQGCPGGLEQYVRGTSQPAVDTDLFLGAKDMAQIPSHRLLTNLKTV